MDIDRALLKARLIMERAVPRPTQRIKGGQAFYYVCLCDLCGAYDPTHLHENIVTRADVMHNKPLQQLILTAPENVHLLCANCNLNLALAEPFHSWLISLNLYRYGLERMVEWLESLPFKTGPGPYLRAVRNAAQDMAENDYQYRWNLIAEELADRNIPAQPYTYEEVKQWQSTSSPARP